MGVAAGLIAYRLYLVLTKKNTNAGQHSGGGTIGSQPSNDNQTT